jgi:hypothetical protein
VLVRNTADVAVYLPQPSLNPGMIVNLKKVSNNTFEILIQVVDGTNIDDDSAYSFNTYGKNIQLQSDGTGWYVLSGQ